MSRTLLLGLDGATFTVLDALMEQGLMPSLRRLCAGGVRAGLQSTVTPLTPLRSAGEAFATVTDPAGNVVGLYQQPGS